MRGPAGWVALARAWRLRALLTAAGAELALVGWLDGPLPIPGRSVRDVVTPFAPLAFGFGLLACSRALVSATLELRHPRRPARRLGFLLAVFAAGVLTALGAHAIAPSVESAMLVRNLVFFCGVVLLAGEARMSAALLGLVSYCTVAWIIGAGGMGMSAKPWALPLLPSDHWGAALVAACTGAAGMLRFVLARPTLSRP